MLKALSFTKLTMDFMWLSFCSDTIYTNYVCFNMKSMPYEGTSKQLATLTFEYIDIFHDKNKTGLTSHA